MAAKAQRGHGCSRPIYVLREAGVRRRRISIARSGEVGDRHGCNLAHWWCGRKGRGGFGSGRVVEAAERERVQALRESKTKIMSAFLFVVSNPVNVHTYIMWKLWGFPASHPPRPRPPSSPVASRSMRTQLGAPGPLTARSGGARLTGSGGCPPSPCRPPRRSCPSGPWPLPVAPSPSASSAHITHNLTRTKGSLTCNHAAVWSRVVPKTLSKQEAQVAAPSFVWSSAVYANARRKSG